MLVALLKLIFFKFRSTAFEQLTHGPILPSLFFMDYGLALFPQPREQSFKIRESRSVLS